MTHFWNAIGWEGGNFNVVGVSLDGQAQRSS